MMGRIVDPKEIAAKKLKGEIESQEFEHELHDHTFGTTVKERLLHVSQLQVSHNFGSPLTGITSDPLTQFACAFSALIHDLGT